MTACRGFGSHPPRSRPQPVTSRTQPASPLLDAAGRLEMTRDSGDLSRRTPRGARVLWEKLPASLPLRPGASSGVRWRHHSGRGRGTCRCCCSPPRAPAPRPHHRASGLGPAVPAATARRRLYNSLLPGSLSTRPVAAIKPTRRPRLLPEPPSSANPDFPASFDAFRSPRVWPLLSQPLPFSVPRSSTPHPLP